MTDLTPAMTRYLEVKQQHPGCLLLFRMGDFYEMFFEDAQVASKILGLTLNHRSKIPMAGFPYHTLEGYLRKLIKEGHRVAVCEAADYAPPPRGIVSREVNSVAKPARRGVKPLVQGDLFG